jgi:hypothetical protein
VDTDESTDFAADVYIDPDTDQYADIRGAVEESQIQGRHVVRSMG